jgi:hypothetical protein
MLPASLFEREGLCDGFAVLADNVRASLDLGVQEVLSRLILLHFEVSFRIVKVLIS